MSANPLRVGLVEERLPEPCTIVIFGASGDLTKRKLLPALYSLARDRLLPPAIAIVGYARREIPDDDFRKQMREGVVKYARRRPTQGGSPGSAGGGGVAPLKAEDDAFWQSFAEGIFYQPGNFDDVEAYRRLGARLEEIDKARGIPGNRIFYLSTPPNNFPTILANLRAAGLVKPQADDVRPFARVVIEKPFGTDLTSARKLNREVLEVASERQIYRIDHYLGKETVQNLMAFRFSNGIFEPLWNSKYVDHVQITGAESIGIEGRGNYFEQAGILRDMVQNHLFQIVCMTAMEPPVAMSADDLRDEKLKVLKALRPIPSAEMDHYVVRGQYRPGSVGGKRLAGYREEPGVAPGSTTETYVAMKFFIDDWRWADVPFYLRAGKAMPKKVTEVALVFKKAPLRLFGNQELDLEGNVLAIRIQPDEGISLKFGSKVPGPTMQIHPVNMEFRYGSSFGTEPPEAYERLLLDCMLGDPSLFTRGDEVEASWTWIQRILDTWREEHVSEIPTYEAGTWGPQEADDILAADGRRWRRP
jgi:glucose-6-phosphate 1-dehydrogenase